ncbi:hypothetical protein GCM10009592_11150 [Brachybacterium rhamnosum]|uniref:Integral membrane protein n=1 Tax=Brachybacterium rhamnosum TaxID=173361 RepID=A0ABW4PXA3_9MICO|nr:hypothetical protein [Brachybacterium sp. SGAir0954]QCR52757.1 hypothetical protein C1N80_03630 [Brachybacterium sp. SGAir0954]
MLLGLCSAGGAALCYGIGSVLQADAARRTTASTGLDPRLLTRLLRSGRYLIGVAADGAGFLLSLLAVRSLPLFVVQSVVASFLAVTAVLAAVLLRMPLGGRDRAGIAVVVGGLVLVGASAAPDHAVALPPAGDRAVLGGALLLVPAAMVVGRAPWHRGAAGLGAVAGLAFGVTAIASRVLPGPAGQPPGRYLLTLLTDPSSYALVLAGALALLTYSTALQRGSVTRATAPLVVGETLVPALVGVIALGDRPRPGWEWAAILGCLAASAGAVSLARHGEIEPDPAPVGPDRKDPA